METDKSGELAFTKKENHLENMKTHLNEDPKITWKEKCDLEREMNAHTIQMGRILRLGEKWNSGGRHWKRVKNALRTRFSLVPPLSGTAKTHKPLPPGREYLGHPLRPVCGASQCSDGPLAWLLSEILDRLGDRMDLQVGTLC